MGKILIFPFNSTRRVSYSCYVSKHLYKFICLVYQIGM
nr:MAG TPA: hypothetical protein [Caudoviricetes sp.]